MSFMLVQGAINESAEQIERDYMQETVDQDKEFLSMICTKPEASLQGSRVATETKTKTKRKVAERRTRIYGWSRKKA
jgi:hypothetical protein